MIYNMHGVRWGYFLIQNVFDEHSAILFLIKSGPNLEATSTQVWNAQLQKKV